MALPVELHGLSTDSLRQSFCDLVQTFAHLLDPGIEIHAHTSLPQQTSADHDSCPPDTDELLPVAALHHARDSSAAADDVEEHTENSSAAEGCERALDTTAAVAGAAHPSDRACYAALRSHRSVCSDTYNRKCSVQIHKFCIEYLTTAMCSCAGYLVVYLSYLHSSWG